MKEIKRGFRIYHWVGDDIEIDGYYLGELTLEKLKKIARVLLDWMDDRQFKDVHFDADLSRFQWYGDFDTDYYVEKIEFKEI